MIVDRLRGIYRIPITDGLGPTGGGEEPDNPNEFVRTFQTPPIQHEAADLITELVAALEAVQGTYIEDPDVGKMVDAVLARARSKGGE